VSLKEENIFEFDILVIFNSNDMARYSCGIQVNYTRERLKLRFRFERARSYFSAI